MRFDQDDPPIVGDRLDADVRLVVATAAGTFERCDQNPVRSGAHVRSGSEIGIIRNLSCAWSVLSPFEGRVVEELVAPGERVTKGQPLLWLWSNAVEAGEAHQ